MTFRISVLRLALDRAKGKDRTLKSLMAYLAVSTGIVIGFFVITLLASEYYLRWHYRDILSTASGVNYFYRRSWPKFASEFNELKLRGSHFDIKKDSQLRIAVLGDSLTWGQGVFPRNKRFTERVEKMFHECYPDIDVEIINLGICGQNLPQHNKYAHFVLALHPDFVLYQWYINDMEISRNHRAILTPPLFSKKWHRFFIKRSVLYYLAHHAWGQIRVKRGLQENYHEYLAERFADENSPSSIKARKYLNKLLDKFDDAGIKVGIVLFPSFSEPMEEYPLGFLHDQVLSVCDKRDIDCLDLRSAYKPLDSHYKDLWANRFDAHPSALAHSVAATEIFNHFGKKWAGIVSKVK